MMLNIKMAFALNVMQNIQVIFTRTVLDVSAALLPAHFFGVGDLSMGALVGHVGEHMSSFS